MNNINDRLNILNWNIYPYPRQPNDEDLALFIIIILHTVFNHAQYRRRVRNYYNNK